MAEIDKNFETLNSLFEEAHSMTLEKPSDNSILKNEKINDGKDLIGKTNENAVNKLRNEINLQNFIDKINFIKNAINDAIKADNEYISKTSAALIEKIPTAILPPLHNKNLFQLEVVKSRKLVPSKGSVFTSILIMLTTITVGVIAAIMVMK